MKGYLIRPHAWWFNKVPLSVTLTLLLIDGGRLSVRALLALGLVVLSVCAVGNYGYALNDLYDVEEDSRTGRANAAQALGLGRTRIIVVASAFVAEAVATAAAGWAGAALTGAALTLPALYSIPPFRVKERKWLGVGADALAAHVYPAALAILSVAHLGVWRAPAFLVVCVLAWSAAVGVRGILSHQLYTAERDRQGRLNTLVHDLGRVPLERFIVFVLLPIEAAGFVGAVMACRGGVVLWLLGALYLASEAFKTMDGRFTVTAFRLEGQRHLPFVDEGFYKGWGPIVIALDAARNDVMFLLPPLVYVFLFRRHLRAERGKLRALGRALLTPARSA